MFIVTPTRKCDIIYKTFNIEERKRHFGLKAKGMNKQKQRQEKLLDYIKNKEFVGTKGLEDIVGCSYPTLCRDLKELEDRNEILRMHGGIKYAKKDINSLSLQHVAISDYYMYQARTAINAEEKKAIGQAATQLLKPNDIIFITHGTTTVQFAQAIDTNQILTVITDGLDTINSLAMHPNLRVYATGGVMSYSSMQIEHNPFLSCDIGSININKLVMGIGGISLSHGITFYDFTSFKFIQQILEQVNEIIVLADYTKLESVALANFIPIDKISTLVTDWNADTAFVTELEARGIQCIIAQNPNT